MLGSGGRAAVAPRLPDSADGRLVGGDCPVQIPAGYRASCGTLTVPENRTAKTPATIDLRVVVFAGNKPGSVPVVYLDGGPGGPAIDDVTGLIQYFAPILRDHDLVVFDQRGTGHDSPSLACPEIDKADSTAASLDELHLAEINAVKACRDRLVASGVDPATYTTHANAADVDDLRAELGYDRWHVFGVSYGTRLALDVARYYPRGVASVAIDSVLPPQVDFIADSVPNALRSFHQTFAGCAAQADCSKAYPNLETILSALVASLDQTPASVTLNDGSTQKVTGDDVLQLLFMLSYSTETLPLLPEIIYQFNEGNLDVMKAVLNGGASTTPAIAWGMYLSVVCSEYTAYSSLAAVDTANAGIDPLFVQALGSSDFFDLCTAWGVPAAPAAERAPAASNIPALVLSGIYDPVTPPAWAELASTSLSRSHYLSFQNETHGVFTDTCGGDLLAAFWANPAADPSAMCPNRNSALPFSVLPGRLPAGATLSQFDPGALMPESVVDSMRRRVR